MDTQFLTTGLKFARRVVELMDLTWKINGHFKCPFTGVLLVVFFCRHSVIVSGKLLLAYEYFQTLWLTFRRLNSFCRCER